MPVACGGPSELLTRVPAQSAVEKIAPSKPPKKRRFMVTSGFGETKSLNHAVAGRGKSSAALRPCWRRYRGAARVVQGDPIAPGAAAGCRKRLKRSYCVPRQ